LKSLPSIFFGGGRSKGGQGDGGTNGGECGGGGKVGEAVAVAHYQKLAGTDTCSFFGGRGHEASPVVDVVKVDGTGAGHFVNAVGFAKGVEI